MNLKHLMVFQDLPFPFPRDLMPEHTIEALCRRSHEISLSKGWVTEEGDPRSYACITNLNHSELSEAMEDWRNNRKVTEIWYELSGLKDGVKLSHTISKEDRAAEKSLFVFDGPADAKPCGIPIELADFVIRVAQHVGTAKLGAELQSLVNEYHGNLSNTANEADALEVAPYDDFDDLLAYLHLKVSASYRMRTEKAGETEYLKPLAEALTCLFASCRVLRVDLWAAIDEKEAYNRTRGIKHGGKKV